MRLYKVEIFGPILPIFSFEKVSEIDKIILSTPDPLALYIFSDDKEFSENIIRECDLVVGLLMIPLFT